MGVYVTAATVRALAHPDAELPAVDADLEKLIAEGEQDVDLVIGGARLATGRALDPAALGAAQRGALEQAVTRAVEHRLLADVEDIVGGLSLAPSDVAILARPTRPPTPAIAHALAGFALIRRSGTVTPTEDELPAA